MGSPTLNLQTVELVSVIRTAPKNGAPSSLDYYDGEIEKVTDLSTITLFINNTLLPILNSLPAIAAAGLLGTACYTDTANQDSLVYDELTGTPLTITESLRLLSGQIQTMNTALIGVSQQAASLQARLSASNQSDISQALNNLTSVLATNTAQVQALTTTVGSIQALVGSEQDLVVSTGSVAANGLAQITVNWANAFPDNTYSFLSSMEDASGYLQIVSYAYQAGGAGVYVNVKNNDTGAAHTGNIHATGRANSAT
jgi:hypothetical protein